MKVVTPHGTYTVTFKHFDNKIPEETKVTLKTDKNVATSATVRRYHSDEPNTKKAETFALSKVLESLSLDYKIKADFWLAFNAKK